MVQVVRLFNQKYSKQYKNLGFEKIKMSYIRKSNDVLHIFTLKNDKNEKRMDIEFNVMPLCDEEPLRWITGKYIISKGTYQLKNFSDDPDTGFMGWKYDDTSENEAEICIEEVGCAVNNYLLPFFDRCKDCKSALLELLKIEKLFDDNRLNILRELNMSDSAQPWEERSLFDTQKYYMALKSHNVNYVRRYFNHMIEHYKKSLTSFKTSSTKQPESVIKNHEEALIEFEQKLDRFNSEGFAYFDKIIEKNEKLMTEILLSKNFTIM